MAYGCVPFLSNIGGNLELCGFENGILADVEAGTMDLSGFVENGVCKLRVSKHPANAIRRKLFFQS